MTDTPPPAAEQLLHLIDRAEAGTLLAPEARLLRDGIRTLTTDRDQHARDAQLWADAATGADQVRKLAEHDRDQARKERDRLRGQLRSVARLSEGAEQRLEAVRAERHRYATTVQRIRQMANAWEQQLPETILTATAVEAIRTALDTRLGPAAPAETARLAAAVARVLEAAETLHPDHARDTILAALADPAVSVPDHCQRCHGHEDGPCHGHADGCPGCQAPAAEQPRCRAGQDAERCPPGAHPGLPYPWTCPSPPEAAEASVQRVRQMHHGVGFVAAAAAGEPPEPTCGHCDQPWPCDTIRALDGPAPAASGDETRRIPLDIPECPSTCFCRTADRPQDTEETP